MLFGLDRFCVRVKHYFKLSLKKSISMDEVRRTIMNEFSDEKSCDMFIMQLNEK